MRRVAVSKPEAIKWIGMKHGADCWIAACAMAADVPYEEAEKAFGPGAEYSAKVLDDAPGTDPIRRVMRRFLYVQQYAFFIDHGCYALLIPEVNPRLKRGRRYLLSASSCDPQNPSMAHTIVVNEAGKVFDPDPKYDPKDPRYSIENYVDLVGWEIVRWKRD